MSKEHAKVADSSKDLLDIRDAKDVGVYAQDIVIKKDDNSIIGVVTQVGADSDSESDITDDDDEEDDNNTNNNEDEDGKENANAEADGVDDGNDDLSPDQVRVVWMDHSETTHNINDLRVIDRSFLHGDIVAYASEPTGQVGVVEDVSIKVDLLVHDGNIVKDVCCKYLRRIAEFTIGDYVVFGPWLGRVEDVVHNVTVSFDDGGMCKVTKADPLRLHPLSKNFIGDGHFPYYPGQRVRASSSSVFKSARWISGLWKASRMEGTVTQVTVASVFIYWIASAGYGPECATTPAEEQSPKNLKLLDCFAHAAWQVGDWCFLPSPDVVDDKSSSSVKSTGCASQDPESEHNMKSILLEQSGENHLTSQNSSAVDLDSVPCLYRHTGNVETSVSLGSKSCTSSLSVSKEPGHENRPVHRKKLRKVAMRKDKKGRKKDEKFERALLIVNTKTRVDVIWQDGRREHGLVSTNLIPIDNPGDQEFVAEQYVVEKATEEDDDASTVRRVGVVKTVNAKERTASVRWLKPLSRPEDFREFDNEEVVSVYELESHPDYDYCYGDVVVRLTPVTVSVLDDDSAGSFEGAQEQDYLNEAISERNPESKELEDPLKFESHADFSDLTWVGKISGIKDGDIEVTWADGMVSTVGPQAIYVVGRDDDEDSIGAESDISDFDAASWETYNEDDTDAAELEAGSQKSNSVISEEADSEESSSVQNGPLSIPLAALGFSTRLLTGFFLWGKKQIDPLISDYSNGTGSQSPGAIDASERRASSTGSSSLESNTILSENEEQDVLVPEATDKIMVPETLSRLASDEAVVQSIMQSSGNSSFSFKHFDTAKDPLDHHFLGSTEQSNSGRKWLKKVQQDWSILLKNLPDSIFVRVYEDRMDLLRAVIVGAYGTPYQDGLFVFDFHLPPEYPQVPPSAYYHSGGWRINPNLYEEGKVCLSLLNTWSGRGNEVWDPSSSSILQVLVSLQGLVLNSKPYFNEAGYDKQVGTAEGEKNSLSYNENTFLLNCKSVMYLLRKPPKDFEELIKDHFKRRGYYILKACDAYMKGHLIGSLTEDASLTDKSSKDSTSVGFKMMLKKIMPKLITSLSDIGANVEQFKHLQES